MRNLLITSTLLLLVLFGCKKEEIGGTFPEYSIEGLWVIENYPNTAYIFENNLRYTVYCIAPNCNWDTITITDAIPGHEAYTFLNDTLTVDLGNGNSSSNYMKFVCGGEVVKREYDQDQYLRWSRSSYDISACAN